jgi:glucokinase
VTANQSGRATDVADQPRPESATDIARAAEPARAAAAEQVIAVDVGGTKLAGALVDRAGRLTGYRVRPTRPAGPGGADPVWPDLAALVGELCAAAQGPLLGIGVGSAGPLDLTLGTVSPVNIPGWRRFPLAQRLAEHTGLPVRLAGDGICAAIGEHWLGAARGLDDVVVIVVSTGVGGGVIQRGRLHAGRSGNAGHIGHMVVDFDGDPCPCGGHGCVEGLSSGPSMTAWALRQGWRPVREPAGAAELADAARAGDPVALAAFDRAARALAAGITSIAAACDLTHAVLGGGVSRAADLLLPPLHTALADYARLDFVRDLQVGIAELGSQAGLFGAAALLLSPERYADRTPTAAPLVRAG